MNYGDADTRTNAGQGRPGDMRELKGMFASRALRLPKQLEQIALVALARPDLVAFGSARSIALACAVSPTTVARFATALGFNDFRDLKAFFQQHLRNARMISASP
ncbi:transcriptional regulator [Ensifer sp. LC13]|nr:transcriptional regulator [Ensifer sp. LC11]OCP00388.1 transcriptional regulator [Ensifer sp. LC13]OCP04156.1 transcriptional regulator [Ensifer sp. LC14]OCP31424.1 transcriptional regulator [Ensifer sp. LC499]